MEIFPVPPLANVDLSRGQLALNANDVIHIQYKGKWIDLTEIEFKVFNQLQNLFKEIGEHHLSKNKIVISLDPNAYPELKSQIQSINAIFKQLFGQQYQPQDMQIHISQPHRPYEPIGLKRMVKDKDHVFTPAVADYERGKIIGERYIYTKDKQLGIEPGFEATRTWTDEDDEKLKDPTHKFHAFAASYIEKELKSKSDNVFQSLFKDKKFKGLETFVNQVITSEDPAFKALYLKVKEEVMRQESKFTKRHIVKLDYHDPTADGVVSLPRERLKHKKNFIVKAAMQMARTEPIRQKNLGAVLEALSNDLMIALERSKHPDQQIRSQKLKLIQTQYEEVDGKTYPKLLLDSTDLGKNFKTLRELNAIKDGRIPNQEVIHEGKTYKLDSQQLASGYIKFLLFGDRDKVGSRGDNLGVILENDRAFLANIDTGKSLNPKPNLSNADRPQRFDYDSKIEYLFDLAIFTLRYFFIGQTDRMLHQNVRSNLTFETPKETIRDRFAGTYPNYSIFLDTTLSERVQGWKEVRENWAEVKEVFKAYQKEFGEDKGEDLNFSTELQETFNRLVERKMHFEEVLGTRVSLSNQELDVLDNIEKLTSETTNRAGSKSNPIKLRHLAIKPSSRKEWNMAMTAVGYELTFTARTALEKEDVKTRLAHYIQSTKLAGVEKPQLIEDPNTLTLKLIFPKDQIKQMHEFFSEKRISLFKPGQTIL